MSAPKLVKVADGVWVNPEQVATVSGADLSAHIQLCGAKPVNLNVAAQEVVDILNGESA